MSISDVIREAIAQYCEDKEMKRVFIEYQAQERAKVSTERFRAFVDNYNKEGAQ